MKKILVIKEKLKNIKKVKVEKIFGKEENKAYRFKRNSFFIIIGILFLISFFLIRYFNILKDLILINIKYIKLFNFISLTGLIVIIFCFYLADKSFNLNFKKRHYFFIYFTLIVGVFLSFLYFKYPYYDKFEHFFFPMMYASIAYHIVSRHKLNLFWKLFFTFFIIIGSISIFELVEYFLDLLFDWKLQGVFFENLGNYEIILDKIDDTMIDVGLGVLGTLAYVFSVVFIEFRKKHKRL